MNKDLEEFKAEIKSLTTRLTELENEKQDLRSTDSRFWEILSDKNNIRIKLKAVETRMANLGNLDKLSKELLQTIPRF